MKTKKLTTILLPALLLLAGCSNKPAGSDVASNKTSSPTSINDSINNSSTSDEPEVTMIDVTFDLNYEGSTSEVVKVQKGGLVSVIDDPVRTGYLFTGWFTAKENGNEADFSAPVIEAVTYYAHWEQVDSENIATVTYLYNYEGNTSAFKTVQMKKRRRVSKLSSDPEREGYRFSGWFDDAACQTPHDYTSTVTGDLTLYAGWLKETVFEAEYTNLDGKSGLGYSGNCSDIEMIQKDIYGGGASNGFYISWLYYNGSYVEWEINSDKAVSDVWLTARLSVEFFDMTLTQDTYQTYVNDTLQSSAYTLVLSGAVAAGTKGIRPFQDYILNTQVSLKAGLNKIKLYTNNSDYYTGTMSASAPLVDAIKLATNDATLSWADGYPKTTNLRLYQS